AGDTNGTIDIFLTEVELVPHEHAIFAGLYAQFSFNVGQASSASVTWGDGTSVTVTPVGGVTSFRHAFENFGTNAVVVTVTEGSLTWAVPYRIDLDTEQMGRDTALLDTLSGSAGTDTLSGDS